MAYVLLRFSEFCFLLSKKLPSEKLNSENCRILPKRKGKNSFHKVRACNLTACVIWVIMSES